jgi:electron transfer flavoprotein alpha/beta subunit
LEVERNAAAAGWPVITRVEEFHTDDGERIFVIRSTPAPQPQIEGLDAGACK